MKSFLYDWAGRTLYDWAGRTNSWVKLVGNQQLHIPVHLKITLVHLSNEPGPEEPRRNSRGKDLQNGRNAWDTLRCPQAEKPVKQIQCCCSSTRCLFHQLGSSSGVFRAQISARLPSLLITCLESNISGFLSIALSGTQGAGSSFQWHSEDESR